MKSIIINKWRNTKKWYHGSAKRPPEIFRNICLRISTFRHGSGLWGRLTRHEKERKRYPDFPKSLQTFWLNIFWSDETSQKHSLKNTLSSVKHGGGSITSFSSAGNHGPWITLSFIYLFRMKPGVSVRPLKRRKHSFQHDEEPKHKNQEEKPQCVNGPVRIQT